MDIILTLLAIFIGLSPYFVAFALADMAIKNRHEWRVNEEWFSLRIGQETEFDDGGDNRSHDGDNQCPNLVTVSATKFFDILSDKGLFSFECV